MTEFRLMTDALDKVYEALDMQAEREAALPGEKWCEECRCESNHTTAMHREAVAEQHDPEHDCHCAVCVDRRDEAEGRQEP